MGFFKIFYYLKRILYHIPKKILVLFIIFLILFISNVQATTVTNLPNDDVYEQLRLIYEQDFGKLLYTYIRNARQNNYTWDDKFQGFCRSITLNAGRISWFISSSYSGNYFRGSNRVDWLVNGSNKNHILYGYYIDSNTSYTYNSDSFSIGGADNGSTYGASNWFFVVPSNQTSFIFDGYITANGVTTSQLTGYMYMPQDLTNYIPPQYFSYIYDIGYNQFNFSNTDNILNTIDNDIKQTNNKLNQMNNEIADMNDYLQDDTISNYTSSDLPSDSLNDITSSGFNSIFTRIYNAFTSNTVQTVTITIPYLDYPVTVRGDYLSSMLTNHGFSSIVSIINVVWYALVSLYIVKDLYKYINQIKNGDIGHTDTNIKTEVL